MTGTTMNRIQVRQKLILNCEMKKETDVSENKLMQLAFKLFLFGFILTFVGIFLVLLAGMLSNGSVDFGGIIIIGPIPIIFGAGEHAWLIILVAAVLTIVCLVLFFSVRRQKLGEL